MVAPDGGHGASTASGNGTSLCRKGARSWRCDATMLRQAQRRRCSRHQQPPCQLRRTPACSRDPLRGPARSAEPDGGRGATAAIRSPRSKLAARISAAALPPQAAPRPARRTTPGPGWTTTSSTSTTTCATPACRARPAGGAAAAWWRACRPSASTARAALGVLRARGPRGRPSSAVLVAAAPRRWPRPGADLLEGACSRPIPPRRCRHAARPICAAVANAERAPSSPATSRSVRRASRARRCRRTRPLPPPRPTAPSAELAAPRCAACARLLGYSIRPLHEARRSPGRLGPQLPPPAPWCSPPTDATHRAPRASAARSTTSLIASVTGAVARDLRAHHANPTTASTSAPRCPSARASARAPPGRRRSGTSTCPSWETRRRAPPRSACASSTARSATGTLQPAARRGRARGPRGAPHRLRGLLALGASAISDRSARALCAFGVNVPGAAAAAVLLSGARLAEARVRARPPARRRGRPRRRRAERSPASSAWASICSIF